MNEMDNIITQVEFSMNLKILRERAELTQQQIADMLHIDRSTYAYYETAKTMPDILTLFKLSKIFNVSVEQFFKRNSTILICKKRNFD